MMKLFPFESLSPAYQRRLFGASLAAVFFLTLALNAVGARLNTAAAPLGIVSYELAGDLDAARAILTSWDAEARLRAAFSLGLDYLYMVAYPTALSLACLWASRRMAGTGRPLARLGRPLAWGQWLAALLDAFENLALAGLLFGSQNPLLPPWAAACAAGKFLFILAGLLYPALSLATRRRYSP